MALEPNCNSRSQLCQYNKCISLTILLFLLWGTKNNIHNIIADIFAIYILTTCLKLNTLIKLYRIFPFLNSVLLSWKFPTKTKPDLNNIPSVDELFQSAELYAVQQNWYFYVIVYFFDVKCCCFSLFGSYLLLNLLLGFNDRC